MGLLVLERILKVFAMYSQGGHLGHVTLTIYTNVLPSQGYTKFGLDFEVVDGRTPEHGHPIRFPFEPSAQVS